MVTRKTTISLLVFGVLVLAHAGPVRAQSRQIPAPAQTGPVVIHSATVHPVSGPPIENGFVIFADGTITGVGSGAAPTVDGAELLDARGLHVYPGLISSDTTLGLVETGAVEVTRDYSEWGDVTPEVRAAVAINPDSDLIPVARANGILTAMVCPSDGLVSGRCALVRLDGWTWEDMAIRAEAGLVLNWPRTEPVDAPWMKKSVPQQRKEIRESLEKIDRFFDDALAYCMARDNDLSTKIDLRYEAMRPMLRRRSPIFVRAASAGQIESAVAWAKRRRMRITIVGGTQADRVAPLLAQERIEVIISGLHRLPSARHDDYDQPFTLPRKLHEAGVRFCIASGAGSAHERNLNHNAATAAAYGLPKDVALRAVTLSAAEILRVAGTLGSLDRGKAATLIVTSGDPLEITTDTLVAFIDGRRIDLGNRQKTLFEKYREKYRQLGMIE